MSNVDLIQAIENVRYWRNQVTMCQTMFDYSFDAHDHEIANKRYQSLQRAEVNLDIARRQLADCMINLQDGYDLALLPKAQVKS